MYYYCGRVSLLNVVCVLVCCKIVFSQQNAGITRPERVLITSSSNVKYLEVPTSDDPLLTWMEVRKGRFPDISDDLTSVANVTVGDPVTLFIFFKDDSTLYDIKVTDCWTHDQKNPLLSGEKLHLTGNASDSKGKMLTEWKRYAFPTKALSFLYASFISFKFPDKNQVYLRCDIQLVGRGQFNNTTPSPNHLR